MGSEPEFDPFAAKVIRLILFLSLLLPLVLFALFMLLVGIVTFWVEVFGTSAA